MTTMTVAQPQQRTAVVGQQLASLMRRNAGTLLLCTATVMVAGALFSSSGPLAVLSVMTALAMIAAMLWLWKRDKNIVISVIATAAAIAAVMAFATSITVTEYVTGGGAYYLAYLTAAPALSGLIWVLGRGRAFPRGRTTILAQLVLLATMPIHRWLGGSVAGVLSGLSLGLLVIWLAARNTEAAIPSPIRWRRIVGTGARIVGGLVVASLLALTVMLGGSAKAQAFDPTFGLGGKIKNSVSKSAHDAICAVTQPNTDPEQPGSGPESWFPNRNLANAPGVAKATMDPKDPFNIQYTPGPVPEYAKDARIGPRDPDIANGKYTLYDLVGLRGLSWVNWQYDAGETEGTPQNCSISAWMWTMVGNGIMTVNTYFLQGVIALKELAQSHNPLAWLYDYTNSAVGMLFQKFTIPAAVIGVMLGAIALGIAALRSTGFREKLGKVGTGIFFIALGAFLLNGVSTNPKAGGADYDHPAGSGFYTIASTLDSTIEQLNGGITTGVLSMLEDAGSRDSVCAPVHGTDANSNGQRLSSCVLAETLAYQPFLQGQFGSASRHKMPVPDSRINMDPDKPAAAASNGPAAGGSDWYSSANSTTPLTYLTSAGKIPCYIKYDKCEDLRTYYLVHQGGPDYSRDLASCMNVTNDENKALQQATIGQMSLSQAGICKPLYGTALQLGAPDVYYGGGTFGAFAGTQGMQRVTQAGAALFGTLIVGLCILILSIAILLTHATLFAQFCALPIVFAIGSFFGKTHIVENWLKRCLATFGQRFAYSVAMTMVIFIVCIVFRTDKLSVGLRLLFVGLLLFFFLKLFNKAEDMVSPEHGHSHGANTINALNTSKQQGREQGRKLRQGVGATSRRARQSLGSIGNRNDKKSADEGPSRRAVGGPAGQRRKVPQGASRASTGRRQVGQSRGDNPKATQQMANRARGAQGATQTGRRQRRASGDVNVDATKKPTSQRPQRRPIETSTKN